MQRTRTHEDVELQVDILGRGAELWRGRWWILVSIFAFAAAGGLFALSADPVYEARAYIAPPAPRDVLGLNVGRMQRASSDVSTHRAGFLELLSALDVYTCFIKKLYAPDLRAQYLALQDAHSTDKKSAALTVFVSQLESSGFGRYAVIVQAGSAENARRGLLHYLAFVEGESRRNLTQLVNGELEQKINEMGLQEQLLRVQGHQAWLDRLSALEESRLIAHTLGLKQPIKSLDEPELQHASVGAGFKEYMLGEDALASQINILKARNEIDPFIPGLRELQAASHLYQSYLQEEKKFSTYTLDYFDSDKDKIAPRVPLIIALSAVLGMLTAVSVLMVFRLMRKKP